MYYIENKIYDPITVSCSAQTVNGGTQYIYNTSSTGDAIFTLDKGSATISPNNGTVERPVYEVGFPVQLIVGVA